MGELITLDSYRAKKQIIDKDSQFDAKFKHIVQSMLKEINFLVAEKTVILDDSKESLDRIKSLKQQGWEVKIETTYVCTPPKR